MFKVIVISQPNNVEGEQETLVSLFKAGLQYFHLRKPDSSIAEMRTFISSIPQEYHNRIVLHSHYSLVTEYQLRGIHCTAKGRDEFFEYEELPVQKSISVHGFCEAGAVDQSFAYAFLSPVFDSISKPGYQQGYHHDALQQFLARPHKTDFIALGGVTLNNIQLCKQLGFIGVAMIGGIWGNPNSVVRFENILRVAQNL